MSDSLAWAEGKAEEGEAADKSGETPVLVHPHSSVVAGELHQLLMGIQQILGEEEAVEAIKLVILYYVIRFALFFHFNIFCITSLLLSRE